MSNSDQVFLSSNRRHDAAIRRQNKGYAFRVPTVADAEGVSQFDVARTLKIGMYRVGALITGDQLAGVHNARGQAGVSTESVDRQITRRAGLGCCAGSGCSFATVRARFYMGSSHAELPVIGNSCSFPCAHASPTDASCVCGTPRVTASGSTRGRNVSSGRKLTRRQERRVARN